MQRYIVFQVYAISSMLFLCKNASLLMYINCCLRAQLIFFDVFVAFLLEFEFPAEYRYPDQSLPNAVCGYGIYIIAEGCLRSVRMRNRI